MTFAELVLFGVALAGLIRLLRPVEHRLERVFRRALKPARRASSRPIIDITDYSTKDHDHDAD